MKKTIIITGGHGFIGKNLIEYLRGYYNIVNIDNSILKSPFKTKDHKIININSSIGNKKVISQVLKKYRPKLIFNLAAETHVDNSIMKPEKIVKNNIFETFKFLITIKKNLNLLGKNFKFIQISTDEVYGSIRKYSKQKFTENSKLETNSPYSASKASFDLILLSFIKTYKFPGIITRGCNNFGFYQHYEKLIPKIIKCCFYGKKIPIYDKGHQVREWIFAKDHCKIIKLISEKGEIGEIYNIGSGFRISNIKLTKKIIQYMSKKNLSQKKIGFELIQYVQDRPGHDFKYALNTDKIFKKFKIKFNKKFEYNLHKTIDWNVKFLNGK